MQTSQRVFVGCRALAWKEFRENWWIVVLGMVWMTLMLSQEVGVNFSVFPIDISFRASLLNSYGYVLSGIFQFFINGGALVGVAIGLHQTLAEQWRGTWPYLLHRPLSRPAVIFTKATTGLLLVWGATAVPLLLFLTWAMTWGANSVPFASWMMVPMCYAWLAGGVAYLAAFLCGLRPARWYGSRLFPLVACGWLLILLVYAVEFDEKIALPAVLISLTVCLLAVWQTMREHDFS